MRPPKKRVMLAALAAGAIGFPLAFADTALAHNAITIADIQGQSHVSPYNGKQVDNVPGIVTAVADKGLWIQSAKADRQPATSDGIYVFTKTAPAVKVGDAVTVSGTVTEYRPGGVDSANLSTTEITNPQITVTGTGKVPEAIVIGPGGRVAPEAIHTSNPGDIEHGAKFNPKKNAVDFYESMEGMVVRVSDSVAVSPSNSYGELVVLPGGDGGLRTQRGGVKYTAADANTERVMIDGDLAKIPKANVGDTLPGDVDGVLDYDFGNFRIHAFESPTVESGGIAPETAQAQGDQLAVATYNVENLDPADPQSAFDRHGENIAVNLASPDILAIEEIQDDNGATNDGTVSADATFGKLIDAITAAGGPRYEYRSIDPQNNADGGEPGGNIRVGFLFNPDRVRFSDKEGGDATTPVEVGADGLSVSPGRISPTDSAWDSSRKPLAGEFEFNGQKVIVVANHFNSKGGDDPLYGRNQPPTRSSEDQRHRQAGLVNEFVKQAQAADSDAKVVVLGDINDFEFSGTVETLTDGDALSSAYELLDESERYSYVFEGNSQVLDQILITPNLADGASLDVVHVNSEFADQASDHDPSVIKFSL